MNTLIGFVCGVVILVLIRSWGHNVLTELRLINTNLLGLRGKVNLIASEAGRREDEEINEMPVTPIKMDQ